MWCPLSDEKCKLEWLKAFMWNVPRNLNEPTRLLMSECQGAHHQGTKNKDVWTLKFKCSAQQSQRICPTEGQRPVVLWCLWCFPPRKTQTDFSVLDSADSCITYYKLKSRKISMKKWSILDHKVEKATHGTMKLDFVWCGVFCCCCLGLFCLFFSNKQEIEIVSLCHSFYLFF